MPEQPQPNPPSRAEVEASLRAVSRLLREAHHLGPEAQETLAELVDELGRALGAGTVSAEELAHLRESTAQLAEALHRRHDEGVVAAARDRLEEAVIGVESRAPVVAGVVRRLLDALSNLGI
jgi:predicted nuclease with TOPRIM domain